MAGGIVIAVVLLLFPVLVAIGGLVLAGILGGVLDADARQRNAGSELVELNQ